MTKISFRVSLALCSVLLTTACGSSSDAKAHACAAWEAQGHASDALEGADLDLPDGDVEDLDRAVQEALADFEKRSDAASEANAAAKEAFAKAAEEDPAWVPVQEAAYAELESGWGENTAPVEAACDRIS